MKKKKRRLPVAWKYFSLLIASQSCSRSGQREAGRETHKFIITLPLRTVETELLVILKTGTS